MAHLLVGAASSYSALGFANLILNFGRQKNEDYIETLSGRIYNFQRITATHSGLVWRLDEVKRHSLVYDSIFPVINVKSTWEKIYVGYKFDDNEILRNMNSSTLSDVFLKSEEIRYFNSSKEYSRFFDGLNIDHTKFRRKFIRFVSAEINKDDELAIAFYENNLQYIGNVEYNKFKMMVTLSERPPFLFTSAAISIVGWAMLIFL